MGKNRRSFSDEFKASVVRRHLCEKVPVSDLATEFEIQPSLIHLWVKQVLDQAEKAFERSKGPKPGKMVGDRDKRRIAQLEAKLANKNEVIAELMEENVKAKKSQWGALKGCWVPHDIRDQIVDYVHYWTQRAELPAWQLVLWIGIALSKFDAWKGRYGKVNDHNGRIPRDHWLEDWEREAIVAYHDKHPLEGYRRLTFMMLDDDIVAVSPASTYRVLKAAGRLDRNRWAPSKKGTGFVQPEGPHCHWHIDVSHVNLGGTFYFLITVLDGYSRYIVHWEIRENSQEIDIELVLQRAWEKCPGAKPRVVSDNGPQFMANDFKAFIRIQGLTHVRTAPYYPPSNGKLERWHGSVKRECIRPSCPESVEEARRKVDGYVSHYNHVRLHSAIGYVTPADKLNGLAAEIHAQRDRKLEEARARRQAARAATTSVA